MDHKQDIGKLFKEKLGDATKQPKMELWDEIEVSLDKRDRKRRGFFMFWISTGTAAVLLLLFSLFPSSSLEETTKNTTENEVLIPSENLPVFENDNNLNSEKNNLTLYTDSIQIVNSEENANDKEILIPKENEAVIKRNTNTSSSEKDPFMDDSVTVKTTYHYYNGATKEMLETTDKSVIDSLLKNTIVSPDSLTVVETKMANPMKKDSLNPFE